MKKQELFATLGSFNRVSNLESPASGKPVENQFRVVFDNGSIFQSYGTVIAAAVNGKTYLDGNKYNCSKTTSKYLNQYLGVSSAEREKRIKQGIYEVAELN